MYASALATLLAAAAPAATYHVRVDGGSAQQCDGRHDAALAGAVSRHCAWNHPFVALPPGGPARIAGGDTLLIAAGSYMMGAGAAGTQDLPKCRADWPWDCHAAALPPGPSPRRPTRLAGAGFDSGCGNPPQLWGTQRAASVLDLEGSSNVEIACLEITDHASCIEFHNASAQTARCARDQAPYGAWASVGISAAHAANVRLTDLDIHGLAHDGIRAGALSDWTLQRVRIVGNGWSGWNGDIGADSPDRGSMRFSDVEIAWNGCAERYPGRAHFGCWGEQAGGYGDGLGTGSTGGIWQFERVHVHHNSQDGIDLLHADASAAVLMRDVRAEDNAGNQIKVSGAVRIEQSTVLGTCNALAQQGKLDPADSCRAAGNSISLHLPDRGQALISGNRIEGEGDCLIDLQCAQGGCSGASATISANTLHATSPAAGVAVRPPCALWIAPDSSAIDVRFGDNELGALRGVPCPARVSACAGNHAN